MTLQSGSVAIYVMLKRSETGKTDRFDWIHTNTNPFQRKEVLLPGKILYDLPALRRGWSVIFAVMSGRSFTIAGTTKRRIFMRPSLKLQHLR
jgi:hypothetical protein